jgi:hypothetical protein
MKTINFSIQTLVFILISLLTINNAVNAQDLEKDKETKKIISIKNLIDSQNFIFVPRTVSPLRGSTRQLTSYYDLKISRDTITAYLPYFGRAYTAPLNTSDAGINLNTTNFGYKVTPGKKGSWNILIQPKDDRSISQISLQVFNNANASLNVISQNRSPISYQGYITEKKK